MIHARLAMEHFKIIAILVKISSFYLSKMNVLRIVQVAITRIIIKEMKMFAKDVRLAVQDVVVLRKIIAIEVYYNNDIYYYYY